MNYTDSQTLAFSTRDRSLLVSAAAGSGKTAVLTKRIIDSLLDKDHPSDISKLLIVTFTKASAQDMRAKITKKLSEALAQHPGDKHLSRQMMLLGSASICTIDSFYYDLLHLYFDKTDFGSDVRLVDSSELVGEKKALMNRVLDEMYRTEPEFSIVSDLFCDMLSETKLTEALLQIYHRLCSFPAFLGTLEQSANEMQAHADSPLETAQGRAFMQHCEKLVREGLSLCDAYADEILDEEFEEKLRELFDESVTLYRLSLSALATGIGDKDITAILDTLKNAPAAFSSRKHRPSMSDEFKNLITALIEHQKNYADFCARYKVFSKNEIRESALFSARILRLIYRTLVNYDKELNGFKATKGLAEFADVTRAVYDLLIDPDGAPTTCAREIAERYDAIYIDEYQDVNAVQDATFRAIAKPDNLFLVGDIKQSIYRFRGAQPAVFAKYRKTLPAMNAAKAQDFATIFMSECFRCDKPIIDFANVVFGFLFSHSPERIGYTRADDLNFAKADPSRLPDFVSPKCRVLCVYPEKNSTTKAQTDKGDDLPADITDPEIRMVITEIEKLLKDGKKANGEPIRPADIAILLRKTAKASAFAKGLALAGIPVSNTLRENLLESPEVLCVYSLLVVIDNPLRDISLAATLRSPFFDFTLAELVRIRSGCTREFSLFEALTKASAQTDALGEKCRGFLTVLSRWRDRARQIPTDVLLREIYHEADVFSFSARSGKNAAIVRTNLERLYEYARSFESNGFKGLAQFIDFVDDLFKNKVSVDTTSEVSDAVSIMTVHGSKGLEFPVCFFSDSATYFSNRDITPPLLIDEYLGAAPLLPIAGPLSRANTFWRNSVADELRELSAEEEMRILYVALTRAREQLIITGKPASKMESMIRNAELYANPYMGSLATTATNFMQWILTALECGGCGDHTIIEHHPESDYPPMTDFTMKEEKVEQAPGVLDALKEHFDFTYPYRALSRLPAKLSVSRLTPQILDVFDNDGSPSPAELLSPDEEKLLCDFDRPFFEKQTEDEPTAAQKGTATHEFLQFCDFAYAEQNGIEKELDRLIDKGFLPESIRRAVRINELSRFFESELYGMIKTAKEIFRETRFHIDLPAKNFSKDPEFIEKLGSEMLLVQGVIDLFFVDADGRLILCDYKTDRLSKKELSDPKAAASGLFARHREQLSYYAKAIKELTGRAPDRILLYSLPAGRAYEDPLQAQ